MPQVLMIVSAATSLPAVDGSRLPTGFWASEVLEPHGLLTDAGYDVAVATPKGTRPQPDESSLGDVDEQRLAAIPGLAQPHALTEFEDVSALSALVLPGGHGPMGDLYQDPELGRLLRAAVPADVPIAAICHGPAGLLAALQGPSAAWPFDGMTMTAFSDAEEQQAGMFDKLTWSLEQQLREEGAKLDLAEPSAAKVVVDGLLVSGQNPASARPATEALLEVLGDRG